jgi:hypothetical protein
MLIKPFKTASPRTLGKTFTQRFIKRIITVVEIAMNNQPRVGEWPVGKKA